MAKKCPNCGSQNISPYKEAEAYAEDGFWAILASLLNPAAAHHYAHRALEAHKYKCNKCGKVFD